MADSIKLDYGKAEESLSKIDKAKESLSHEITTLNNLIKELEEGTFWKGQDATEYISNVRRKNEFLVKLQSRMESRRKELQAYYDQKKSDEESYTNKASTVGTGA